MKKAYYIISREKFRAKEAQEEDFFIHDIGEVLQNDFVAIQHRGYILAADEYYYYSLGSQLVGIQVYVPLSCGICAHWREKMVKPAMFGFVFNAQHLIEHGALLGIEHLARDYDRIPLDVIEHVLSTLPPPEDLFVQEDLDDEERAELQEWITHSKAKWFRELDDVNRHTPEREDLIDEIRRNIQHLQDLEQNLEDGILPERHYSQDMIDNHNRTLLFEALRENNLDAPGCKEVIDEVQRQVRRVNAHKLLQGETALAYLEHAPEDGSCVLFVRQQLSLAHTIGIVQQGKERKYVCQLMTERKHM